MERRYLIRAIKMALRSQEISEPGKIELLATRIADEIERAQDLFADDAEPQATQPLRPNLDVDALKRLAGFPQPTFGKDRLIIGPDDPEAQGILKPEGEIQPIRLKPVAIPESPAEDLEPWNRPENQDKWELGELLQAAHRHTPPEITVTPVGMSHPVVLRRNIIQSPTLKSVKLQYTVDGQKTSEASKSNAVVNAQGIVVAATEMAPMNLDKQASTAFTCKDPNDPSIFTRAVEKLTADAREIFRPLPTEIHSSTPVRTGQLSLQGARWEEAPDHIPSSELPPGIRK